MLTKTRELGAVSDFRYVCVLAVLTEEDDALMVQRGHGVTRAQKSVG